MGNIAVGGDEQRAAEFAQQAAQLGDMGINATDLAQIVTADRPRCPRCLNDGHVCEDHPDFPWEGIWGTVEGHREHGGIGMPCPACCSPVPEDGTVSIAQAFVPDWKRA